MENSLDNALPKIERTEIDLQVLRTAENENTFNKIGVDLLVEAGSYACIAASILPADTKKWNRDEAVLGGLLVRLYKLISAILDQTCQQRRETTFIFGRLAFECMVNIQYMISNYSPKLFQAFVLYSLRHEVRLKKRILKNIEAREGKEWPIERRMLNSIDNSIKDSGVKIDEIQPSGWKEWSDKNLYDRACSVDLGEAYLGLFSGPSHSVHGNWQDLLEYNLSEVNGGFKPDLKWHLPRPQVLFTIGIITIDTLRKYLAYLSSVGIEQILEELSDLQERLFIVNREHERFVSLNQKS